MLYIQEKQDIQKLDTYCRGLVQYIGGNELQDCIFRTVSLLNYNISNV